MRFIKILIFLCPMLLLGACARGGSESGKAAEEEVQTDAGDMKDGKTRSNVVVNDGHDDTPALNTKPTLKSMPWDLIGREINDPDPNGYHDQYWKWIIEDGEIKDFKIVETLRDDDNAYVAVAQVVLQAKGNYSLISKLKLIYRNASSEGWVLDGVNSLGLNIMTDGLYDDCVSIKRTSDLYGEHWYIHNDCDVPLTVYYRTFTGSGGEKKQLQTVKPHSDVKASVWSLKDCIIDYVIRQY